MLYIYISRIIFHVPMIYQWNRLQPPSHRPKVLVRVTGGAPDDLRHHQGSSHRSEAEPQLAEDHKGTPKRSVTVMG